MLPYFMINNPVSFETNNRTQGTHNIKTGKLNLKINFNEEEKKTGIRTIYGNTDIYNLTKGKESKLPNNNNNDGEKINFRNIERYMPKPIIFNEDKRIQEIEKINEDIRKSREKPYDTFKRPAYYQHQFYHDKGDQIGNDTPALDPKKQFNKYIAPSPLSYFILNEQNKKFLDDF